MIGGLVFFGASDVANAQKNRERRDEVRQEENQNNKKQEREEQQNQPRNEQRGAAFHAVLLVERYERRGEDVSSEHELAQSRPVLADRSGADALLPRR